MFRGEGDDDVGGGDCCSKRADPVLDSVSDLYSSVRASGTLLVHLILSTDYLFTNYCPSQNVYDFVLRKMFYSRQGLTDTSCSFACTGYKGALQHEASTTKELCIMSTQGNTFTCTSGLWYN